MALTTLYNTFQTTILPWNRIREESHMSFAVLSSLLSTVAKALNAHLCRVVAVRLDITERLRRWWKVRWDTVSARYFGLCSFLLWEAWTQLGARHFCRAVASVSEPRNIKVIWRKSLEGLSRIFTKF